jgi:hypothetical protein
MYNTQRLCFSRTTKISQQVLPEMAELEVTTTLLIDPRNGQVSAEGIELYMLCITAEHSVLLLFFHAHQGSA